MASQSDVMEIEGGEPKKKRRFDSRDFDTIAEYVEDTWQTRKKKRADKERHWKEIDRQIAMTPSVEFKKLPNGEMDSKKLWMAEMELPLQAQALEVLTADARRFMFPDNDPWFSAHSEMTDEYLAGVDLESLISGTENDFPSSVNQENIDRFVEGFLMSIFRQTDLHTRVDRINAESFKYGMGVGRGRTESADRFVHESIGVRREKRKIPVIVPMSIKNVYLDDEPSSAHSMQALSPAHILENSIKFANLAMAANKGSTDPMDPDGGWMPQNVRKVEPTKKDTVTLLEMEGDIIVPRKTVRSLVIPGAIVTVACGAEGTRSVVRFRFRREPFSSYLLFPYHYEHIDDPYPTAPLEKGRPLAMSAADALNRWLDSAMLKNAPPVGYDRNDQMFANDGGPQIHPYAQWGTTDEVKVYNTIGGDPAALVAALQMFVGMYAELTGVLPARLGAQTKSHTTAFAKDIEVERGASRTVDYVKGVGRGPMTRWLDMAYRMGRGVLGANERISYYVEEYGGYVSVTKTDLPENVSFEWLGAAAPADKAAKDAAKAQSMQLAIQLDQLAASQGRPPSIDIKAAIREVLKAGTWADVDAILSAEPITGGPPAAPGLQGADPQNAGLASTALQTLAFGPGSQRA